MTTPTIEYLSYLPKEQQFKYLWLKYIEEIDLSKHCQDTFVGLTSRKIGTRFITGAIKEVEFNDIRLNEIRHPQAFYLCGVSEPYVWERNFHLAFIPKKGGRIVKSGRGIRLSIADAEEVKITPNFIDPTHPMARRKDFNSCRNWQFGWQVKSGLDYSEPRKMKPIQESLIF